jgi:DNA repair photolyase
MTSNEFPAGVKTVAPAPLPEEVKNGSAKTVHHHGNCIYMPNGKAREYSSWACNLYVGCTHMCSYCYNNHGITSGILGGNIVRLKKSLVDEATAYEVFCKELDKYREAIIAAGALLFNFVSDPCIPDTIILNWSCIDYAISQGVPCQVLTKRADFLDHPSVQNALSHPELLRVGFSLTGCDELEPGASPNLERIQAMHVLHQAGIPTWASIEPIIDPQKSLDVLKHSIDFCDHYKIGILSGKKCYTPAQIRKFIHQVNALNPRSVYWKNSLLEFATRNN